MLSMVSPYPTVTAEPPFHAQWVAAGGTFDPVTSEYWLADLYAVGLCGL
jgi:hypothetical protein